MNLLKMLRDNTEGFDRYEIRKFRTALEQELPGAITRAAAAAKGLDLENGTDNESEDNEDE